MEATMFKQLKEIMQHHPVRQAYLFGSHAHGTAGPLSDIDVAVMYDDAVDSDKAESKLFAELSQTLQTDNIDIT